MRALAIDQGTTSTRAFVVDAGRPGKLVCRRTHKQVYPRPGWVEHDPEELLSHIRDCLETTGLADVIGLANQGESCLAWDRETGRAITPVIVWQDQRSASVVERLKADGGEKLTLERAGLPLDAYFSASKLAWIVNSLAQARTLLDQGRLCLGTTDAFFLHRLTGRFVTDISTASRTSLMNLQSGQWDEALCSLFGVPMTALPEIVPTMGDFGAVTVAGKQIPLTASVVDQQAALYGHGCRRPGDTKITFGTGAFALAVSGKSACRSPDGKLLPTVAWQANGAPPVYALDGGVHCAGSAINWGRSLGLFSDFSEIGRFETPPAVARNLVFVPALTGLGCPHWDRTAAGMWLGLSLQTTGLDMMQAMLEGIAFRTGEVVGALAAQVPVGEAISIDGGLSSNSYYCQFLADVLQKQIVVASDPETTCYGVALMAMAASSIDARAPQTAKTYVPGPYRASWKRVFARAIERSVGWQSNTGKPGG